MEIKRLSFEDFDRYKAYLDEIRKSVSYVCNPFCISDQSKIYIVSAAGTKTAIAYDEDYKKQCSVLDGDVQAPSGSNYDIGFYNYNILEDDDCKCVTKNNKDLGNIFKVKYVRQAGSKKSVELEYSLFYDVPDEETAFHYTIEESEDIRAAIEYTLSHNPDKVYLRRTKKYLTDKQIKERLYRLSLNGEMYYRPLFTINGHNIGVFPKTYSPENFFDKVGKEYFSREIPEDLATLMTDTNETYNQLKLVADEYKRQS